MQYNRLAETDSTPRHSLTDEKDLPLPQSKNKSTKKEKTIDQSNLQYLLRRFEALETEVNRLKDQQMKSKIYIKELEQKFNVLQSSFENLIGPNPVPASPFSIATKTKIRNQFKKSNSADIPPQAIPVHYARILSPKRSNSRERLGLFGSLGAASQYQF